MLDSATEQAKQRFTAVLAEKAPELLVPASSMAAGDFMQLLVRRFGVTEPSSQDTMAEVYNRLSMEIGAQV